MTTIANEPRSFAEPRKARSKGNGQMKRGPLPDNPTNEDLGRAIRDVEECVHTSTDGMKKQHKALAERMTKMNGRLQRMEKQQRGIASVVGVDANGDQLARHKRPALLMSQLAFFSTLSGVVFGLFLIIQFFVATWPSLTLFANELLNLILGQTVGAVHPK